MSMSDVKAALAALPEDERAELIKLLEQLDRATKGKVEREDFAAFRRLMLPDYVDGAHLRLMADAFNKISRGELKRVIITMPPRFSKSVNTSFLFPAWYMGKNPTHKIMQVSNTAELAQGFGRQVKNLIQTPEYKIVFPNVKLAADSTAAGRWNTNHGGEYFAVGQGGALAGRGANALILDDIHTEQEALAAEAGDQSVYDKVFSWYALARQRLMPGGSILICMCVAEGEKVLLADGRWVNIETIKAGDLVATWDKGAFAPKRVLNASNQGEDDILKVSSNRNSVRVNARHPFLVVRGGLKKSPKTQADVIKSRDWHYEWVKASDLKEGDVVVTTKNMNPEKPYRPTRYKSAKQFTCEDAWLFGFLFGDGWIVNCRNRGVVGVCIALSVYPELNARFQAAVKSMFGVDMKKTKHGYMRVDNKEIARWLVEKGLQSGAKTKRIPDWVYRMRTPEKRAFLKGFFDADGWHRQAKRKVDTWNVLIANRNLLVDLRRLAATSGFRFDKILSKTAIAQPPGSPKPIIAHSYSCNFTDKSNKVEQKARYKYQSNRNGFQSFRFETIESVVPDGRANVYDLTVEGTENFIAEGFVVHNTRWSQRDLIGQILKAAKERGDEDEWTVIEIPAILPSGRSAWPEFWKVSELEKIRAELPIHRWSAQYMCNPVSVGAALIKSNWWRKWDIDERGKLPEMEYIIQSWDTATTANTRSNFSACTTWGMFYARGPGGKDYPQFILLDAFRARLEFPDLKQKAKELNAKFKPDALLIENTAQGTSLIPELRLAGLPVTPFNPGRVKNDKILRVNGVSDIFKSGQIWYVPSKQADEVIAQFEAFPNSGDGDDYVDSCTQAIATARAGGVIRLERDEDWTEDSQSKPGNRYYSVF